MITLKKKKKSLTLPSKSYPNRWNNNYSKQINEAGIIATAAKSQIIDSATVSDKFYKYPVNDMTGTISTIKVLDLVLVQPH
ncbi:11617_t:CDS:2 [Funneliformis geosporum]|nr:11617_t:CDS:2 [Funneliformis geosporum]